MVGPASSQVVLLQSSLEGLAASCSFYQIIQGTQGIYFLCFSQQSPSKTVFISRDSSVLVNLPNFSEDLYLTCRMCDPNFLSGVLQWAPPVRVSCKLWRVVPVMLTVMFLQGLNYARAYIPDAIWYDYETVSGAVVLGAWGRLIEQGFILSCLWVCSWEEGLWWGTMK